MLTGSPYSQESRAVSSEFIGFIGFVLRGATRAAREG
uniref:Uncharacterized protein n=1 Tax=Mycobacterium riyadhense TaxID=486698 RepID=A0A653EFR4_9MYCO|nr:hypothetical protein BIN_B_01490 [Mycobacterium riyadhense]